jgi:hypothetical protein
MALILPVFRFKNLMKQNILNRYFFVWHRFRIRPDGWRKPVAFYLPVFTVVKFRAIVYCKLPVIDYRYQLPIHYGYFSFPVRPVGRLAVQLAKVACKQPEQTYAYWDNFIKIERIKYQQNCLHYEKFFSVHHFQVLVCDEETSSTFFVPILTVFYSILRYRYTEKFEQLALFKEWSQLYVESGTVHFWMSNPDSFKFRSEAQHIFCSYDYRYRKSMRSHQRCFRPVLWHIVINKLWTTIFFVHLRNHTLYKSSASGSSKNRLSGKCRSRLFSDRNCFNSTTPAKDKKTLTRTD